MDMHATWDILAAGFIGYLVAVGRPQTTRTLREWQIRYMLHTMNKRPDKITQQDLLEFLAMHPWQPETRKSQRAAMRSFFGWAHKFGHIPTNPAEDLPAIHTGHAEARPCPESIYREALEESEDRVKLMLRLAREAGLRRGEIAQVHAMDVRPGPVLLVHGKGAKERTVPITPGLAADITLACAGSWCFESQRGGHLTARSVGVLCSAALGPDVTLHQLRHSFATAAYRGSHNLRAVQKLLGHANLAVTERYLETSEDEMRAAMMAAA